MQLPLRKIFQKRAAGAPRFAISLSGTMIAALSLVLAACVVWAFFMGFMVGKGQNPGDRIQSMTGINLAEDGEKAKDREEPVSVPAGEQAEPATPEAEKPYPFTKPEGESVAAWGNEPPAVVPEPKAAPAKTQRARPAEKKRTETPKAANNQVFNYTFQVAAYKGAGDANRLRDKLEKAGVRASVQKSGKVQLVVIKLRGNESAAAELRSKLEGLKLGKPLQLSKKPVENARRKGGK